MEKVFPKTEIENNLEKGQFATLSAIKSYQFGKNVYSTVINFEDLETFVETFPEVQRDIIPKKVASIRRYIISGLDTNRHFDMRFFSAITVACRGNMFYDEINKKVAIDINESKLSVNDGQHRVAGTIEAIKYLENEFIRSRDKEHTQEISRKLSQLKNMSIPVVIFDGLTKVEESQLFYDINNLAQRPSRNTNIKMNQTDALSKLTRDIAEDNRYLRHYGVEYHKMSLHESNPNNILLTTVYASIKEILNTQFKQDSKFLNDENYEHYKQYVNETFDKMFFVLPADMNVKGKYLLEKSFSLKAISKFICHARNALNLDEETIFGIIGSVDWTFNIDFWKHYDAVKRSNGNIVFGGGTNGGYASVYQMLLDQVK